MRPLYLSICSAALIGMTTLGPTAAYAQNASALNACRKLTNDAERLRCFDRAMRPMETRSLTGKPVPPRQSDIPAGQPIDMTDGMMPDADPETAQFGLPEQKADDGPSFMGRLGRMVGLGSDDDAPESVESFGRDAEADRRQEVRQAVMSGEGEVTYQIRKITTFDFVKKRFFMANGQVWEQTTDTDARIDEGVPPSGTFAVIESTAFGGFKMSLNGGKRRIKVRRVR